MKLVFNGQRSNKLNQGNIQIRGSHLQGIKHGCGIDFFENVIGEVKFRVIVQQPIVGI